MKTRRAGFTILELLVVIGIILLLMALLLPAIKQARERGWRASCANNLHELYIACLNYTADSGGQLPHAASCERISYDSETDTYSSNQVIKGWVDWYNYRTDKRTYWWLEDGKGMTCVKNGTLFPYTGDKGDQGIYVCPTMVRMCQRYPPGGMWDAAKDRPVRSYSMNNALSNHSLYKQGDAPRRMLFADAGYWNNSYSAATNTNWGLKDAPAPSPSTWNDPPITTDPRSPPSRDTVVYRRYSRECDGSLDYGDEYPPRPGSPDRKRDEHIGEYHGGKWVGRLATGKYYGDFGNCVFLDGHVEIIAATNTVSVCEGTWGLY